MAPASHTRLVKTPILLGATYLCRGRLPRSNAQRLGGLDRIWPDILALVIFAILFLALAAWSLKRRD